MTAFVTGAASGIGAATARRLALGGHLVAVADIDEERAEQVAVEVGGVAVLADVTDAASVRVAVKEAEAALGPIAVLVNNAGYDRAARFVDTDEDDWDRSLAVNLRGALACTHAILPGMYDRRRGVIVSVASEAGRGGLPGGAVYSAAKAGVIGFTKAIARESARYGVRCNAVAPGPIDTPLLARTPLRQLMIDATVMGRAGTPEEVAAAIAFLASDDASFITGQTIAVSGGVSMW